MALLRCNKTTSNFPTPDSIGGYGAANNVYGATLRYTNPIVGVTQFKISTVTAGTSPNVVYAVDGGASVTVTLGDWINVPSYNTRFDIAMESAGGSSAFKVEWR